MTSVLFYLLLLYFSFFFFFFNDTATTEIYTLSLHDALPISTPSAKSTACPSTPCRPRSSRTWRSEEHTSELQSRLHLVCRLLLEKKKIKNIHITIELSLSKTQRNISRLLSCAYAYKFTQYWH